MNSSRKKKVLTYWQSWALEMAGRAAKEQSINFEGRLAAAFALSVYFSASIAAIDLAPFNEVCEEHAKWPPLPRSKSFT